MSVKEKENRYLNEAKLVEILKVVYKGKELELLKHNVRAGTAKGDNYASQALACDLTVRIDGKVQNLHWFAKVPQEDQHMRQLMRSAHIEEKEIQMYSKVIPAWKKMIADQNAGFTITLAESPYTEFHKDTTDSIILMENMANQGYRDAINKKKGLSPPYVRAALTALAKYHACGYAYIKSYSSGITEGLKENEVLVRCYIFGDPDEYWKKFGKLFEEGAANTFAPLLEAAQELGQGLDNALKQYHDQHDIFKVRAKQNRPNHTIFNTLCHGDTWFNNMLFKHREDDEPIDCCLVDLANGKWASPMTDLTYFFFTSVTPMLRRTHYTEFLGHYHDELTRFLHRLGEDPTVYPYRQMLTDYNNTCLHGFSVSLQLVPMILCKKEDIIGQGDIDFSKIMDPESKKVEIKKLQNAKMAAIKNEPQIKTVIGGNMLEMIERGIIKLEI